MTQKTKIDLESACGGWGGGGGNTQELVIR